MHVNFLIHDLILRLREAALWARNVRAYDPHARRTRLRGPISIQIQTVDRCNASCTMCPYSSLAKTSPIHFMEDELYLKILKGLSQTGTARDLILMLQNEPLLDRKIPDRVRIARETFGLSIRIRTVTNGAPLTESMINRLRDSGINHISVSIDAIHEDTFGRIREGLYYQQVVENTLSLAKCFGPGRISVKFLRQRANAGEEKAFARYWRAKGIRPKFTEPTNRAGSLKSYERIKPHRPLLWKKLSYPILNRLVPACPLPFTFMSVLFDGRVILCCNDWEPRDVVGDLSRQTLTEVWNGKKINHYRQLLRTHQTEQSLVCADCSLSHRYWSI